MWIILFFLSFYSFGLESFERLKNVRILKAYPDNVILINKGLEDGIMRNDHVKFTNDLEGYASRGLCVKASRETSYWKIYRVPNSAAFSKDFTYTLIGSADSEIPENIQKLRHGYYPVQEEDEKKEEEPESEPENLKLKQDLPEKLSEKDVIKTPGHEMKKTFMEELIDIDRMQEQLSDYRFSLYASPYSRQSLNDGESYLIGLKGKNFGTKYQLETFYEQQKTRFKDPITEESISTNNTKAQIQLVVTQLSHNFSALSLINYQSNYFGKLGTPISHYQIGPIGFTWNLYESKTWKFINFSYIPLYDLRQTEILNSSLNKEIIKNDGLRHGLKLAMKGKINPKFHLENVLWVRPFQDLSSFQIEADNLNLVNDLKLSFNLSDEFFFDYNLSYQKDKLWKTLNNLNDTNIINAIHLRYDFDL